MTNTDFIKLLREQMPEEEYRPYFDEFTAADFDPRAWARAAKEAGMEAVAVLYGNPEADQAAQAADRAIDRLSSL